MKYTKVFVFALSIIAISACGKLIEPKDKGLVEMKKVEEKWNDGFLLARSTARIALSPQVANLQSIRRDLDGVVVSECLNQSKIALGEHMDLSIQGLLRFMGNNNTGAQAKLREGDLKLSLYKLAKKRCDGTSATDETPATVSPMRDWQERMRQ